MDTACAHLRVASSCSLSRLSRCRFGRRRAMVTRTCYATGMVASSSGKRTTSSRRVGRVPWAVGFFLLVCAAVAGAAYFAWPQVGLKADEHALARVAQQGFAGRVSRVVVRDRYGKAVPISVRAGRLWPEGRLPAGEELTVELTVRRPGWAGWLVGHTARKTFVVRTPVARVGGRWLEIGSGTPVTISFDTPVRLVKLRADGRERTLRFAHARTRLPVGIVAGGAKRAGTITVSAVPRMWEQLPPPVRVSWFPARKHAQMLVEPAVSTPLAPGHPITLTFSRRAKQVIGTQLPTIRPAVSGRWQHLDDHTVSFQPSGLGYPLTTQVEVVLPARVSLAQADREGLTRTLRWQVIDGSILRLQQLLAQARYLPLNWQPTRVPVASTADAQLAAAIYRPGRPLPLEVPEHARTSCMPSGRPGNGTS